MGKADITERSPHAHSDCIYMMDDDDDDDDGLMKCKGMMRWPVTLTHAACVPTASWVIRSKCEG